MNLAATIGAVLLSCLFFAGTGLAFVKFFCEIRNKNEKYIDVQEDKSILEYEHQKTPYIKIILFSFTFRLLIMCAGFIICLVFQSKTDFNYEAFSTMWHKWDSTGYINMAKFGYSYLENGENILLVFFPLYSLCVRLTVAVLKNYYISGMTVSVLFYVGAMIYVYKLAVLEFSEQTAWRTLVLISVFPFSFFFGSIHTESITLFMMAASFYYIRRKKWYLVCVFGILSALCRMVGSLVAVAAIVEYLRVYRPLRKLRDRDFQVFWKDIETKFIFIAMISVGGFIYLGINYYISGNPFQFLVYQDSVWHNTTQFFPVTLQNLFRWTFTGLNTLAGCIWIPEIILFALASLLMVMRWRRLPSMYSIFMSCYIAISYAASTLLSAGRYLSIAFPLFFLLADWTAEKEWRYTTAVVVSGLFMGIYLSAFLLNYQVM